MKFLHLATALIASATYINAAPQSKKQNESYRSGNERPVEGKHGEPKNLLPNAGFEEHERGAPYEIFREGVKISSDPTLARTGNRSAYVPQKHNVTRKSGLTEYQASSN
jgi:hypothetical protein